MEPLNIFPSEALFLGECLGEYLESANSEGNKLRFLDLVRRRLLPAFPPLATTDFPLRGLRQIAGLPRKSLIELILIRLERSIAKSKADDVFGLDEKYDEAMIFVKAAVELTKIGGSYFPEIPVPETVLEMTSGDDSEAIKSLFERVARDNGYLELYRTGMRFGALIAQCDAANQMILKHADYVWTDGETFTIGECVEEDLLQELAECEHVQATGIGHDLLISAIRCLNRKYSVTHLDEEFPLIANAVGQVCAFLWQSFGQVVGYFREMDLEARAEDRDSLIPRADRLTPKATRDDVHLAIREAERRLAEQIAEPGRAEMIVRDLAFAIEALAKRLWPAEFGTGSSIPFVLKGHFASEDIRERRFASAAHSLYLSYRRDALHDAASFRCSYVEARYFVAGVRALLELYDLISESRSQGTRPS